MNHDKRYLGGGLPAALWVMLVGGALLATAGVVRAELRGDDCRLYDDYTALPDPYRGWRCAIFHSADIMGSRFRIELRWNRPTVPSRATVLWLGGDDGGRRHAGFERGPHKRRAGQTVDARSIRRRLHDDFAIRSVELRFTDRGAGADDPGGYWAPPRFGFIKPARAFMATLDYLRRADVALLRGEWLTAVGSSNGATVIAFALAYLDAAARLDRAVFISGPFWGDVLRECADPGFVAYVGQNRAAAPGQVDAATIFAMISRQNGWPDCRAAGLDPRRRSALGGERRFSGVDVDVIVGENDVFGPWLLRSNHYWYQQIRADNQSRLVLHGAGHSFWGADADTQTLLVDTIARPAGVAAAGLFTVGGRDLYYSNGAGHCRFRSAASYRRLTGRDDTRSLPDYRELPKRSADAGICRD